MFAKQNNDDSRRQNDLMIYISNACLYVFKMIKNNISLNFSGVNIPPPTPPAQIFQTNHPLN